MAFLYLTLITTQEAPLTPNYILRGSLDPAALLIRPHIVIIGISSDFECDKGEFLLQNTGKVGLWLEKGVGWRSTIVNHVKLIL